MGSNYATGPILHERFIVAQVSKPAVSPISKSANRTTSGGQQVWKSAVQFLDRKPIPAL